MSQEEAVGQPFEHEIRVTWGDCDPARIAYTARIPWFALDAINAWWEEKLGGGWFQMELDRGVGTPFVNMTIDFRSPVTPRHRLLCAVRPVRLGETSVSFEVLGRQDGVLCFEGRFTCVFIAVPRFRKAPPPEDIRAVVEAHLN
ncbi:acyl-CoA thioesterase [Sagittula stellata]|uniref:Thioesterase superfamily protein n=1 Tax=Sagittula stellata (strain ATCC 700073 / DSM 11524 / E-37) TaxID=388399 RepID=A3K0Y4_SAGS3|nr:thioesterase family protein [Sagittula stellata]EBA09449.1 thioesterase superfamily protein [Sagittula stellata E-37]